MHAVVCVNVDTMSQQQWTCSGSSSGNGGTDIKGSDIIGGNGGNSNGIVIGVMVLHRYSYSIIVHGKAYIEKSI